jgi:hypothetical protein
MAGATWKLPLSVAHGRSHSRDVGGDRDLGMLGYADRRVLV